MALMPCLSTLWRQDFPTTMPLRLQHLVPLLPPLQSLDPLCVHLGSHLLITLPLLLCGTLILDRLNSALPLLLPLRFHLPFHLFRLRLLSFFRSSLRIASLSGCGPERLLRLMPLLAILPHPGHL